MVCCSDGLFASGSHAGELIVWDAVDWNVLAYEHILWEESQAQAEIRLASPKPSEMSIQHLTTNGQVTSQQMRANCLGSIKEHVMQSWKIHITTSVRSQLILAAVGSGLYVYSVLTKTVVAYRKVAHDSNVLHTMLLSDRYHHSFLFLGRRQVRRSNRMSTQML